MEPADQTDDGQPQNTQQDDTKSPLMSLYRCNHNIAPELGEKLTDREACPECLVTYHIRVMEDLQGMLDRRGGIFDSKERRCTDPSAITHKDCMRLWVVVKIECYQDITLLETMCRDDSQQAKQWGIETALQRWYQARPDLVRVPGCDDVAQNHTEACKEGGPIPDLTTSQSSDSQRSNQHGENGNPQQSTLNDSIEPSQPTASDTAFPGTKDPASSKNDVLEDVQDIAKPLDPTTSTKDCVIFEAAARLEISQDAPLTAPSSLATATPRSAFKGGNRPRTPASRPRARFAEHTTIIPDNLSCSGTTAQKMHNKHTSAEAARRAAHFHRESLTYMPAEWSSPDGFEKDNTSFFRDTWYKYGLVVAGKWVEDELYEPFVEPNEKAKDDAEVDQVAAVIREVEDSLLKKNREKAKKRKRLAALKEELGKQSANVKKEEKGEEQAESSKVMEGRSGEENDKPVDKTEDGGQRYSALHVGSG